MFPMHAMHVKDCMHVWMDDGWMNGWMDGWMDGWMCVCAFAWMHACMYACMYACTYVWFVCREVFEFMYVMSVGRQLGR